MSQGYDGASVISGRCSGVQERIREVVPQARYIHCYAHDLNLALVDCVRNNRDANEFFALLQVLYVFVSTSKVHVIFMQKQKDLHPDKQPRQQKKLSDTRWACRYSAINAICYTFDALLVTLEDISSGSDRSKAVEARGLLHQVKNFKFLLSLIIFDRVLSCTNSLSEQLQDQKINLSKAADLVLATTETLQEFPEQKSWEHLYGYAKSVAELRGIDTTTHSNEQRSCQLPRRLEDVFVLESTGSRHIATSLEQYKVDLYYPVLDSFLAEINHRFTSQNVQLMKAIQACSPHSNNFLDPESLTTISEAYCLDGDSIRIEARRSLREKEMDDLSDVICELYPLKSAFPTIFKLLHIALTIVVSTAECERSFSALKRIHICAQRCQTRDCVTLLFCQLRRKFQGT